MIIVWRRYSSQRFKSINNSKVISQTGYQCELMVFIFGSLGSVFRLVVRGLQMAGMAKPKGERLGKILFSVRNNRESPYLKKVMLPTKLPG